MNERDEEWGPWIEHDGLGCPCVGMFVRAVYRNPLSGEMVEPKPAGFIAKGGKRSWAWKTHGDLFAGEVVRYRIRKPRGLTILEELLQDLPAPVREGVDA